MSYSYPQNVKFEKTVKLLTIEQKRRLYKLLLLQNLFYHKLHTAKKLPFLAFKLHSLKLAYIKTN